RERGLVDLPVAVVVHAFLPGAGDRDVVVRFARPLAHRGALVVLEDADLRRVQAAAQGEGGEDDPAAVARLERDVGAADEVPVRVDARVDLRARLHDGGPDLLRVGPFEPRGVPRHLERVRLARLAVRVVPAELTRRALDAGAGGVRVLVHRRRSG